MMSGLTRPRLADKPTTEVCTWICAAPETVWGLVTDIQLMTTLSDELYGVEWIAPATGPRIGAAFRGDNRNGSTQWSSISYIVDYEPNHVFAWATSDVANPGAVWRFTLQSDRGGTQLTQWVQIGTGQSGVSAAVQAYPDREQAIVTARLRQFEHGMSHNLAAIKGMAERA
jgi:hypothetical protein